MATNRCCIEPALGLGFVDGEPFWFENLVMVPFLDVEVKNMFGVS